eukprot:7651487-Alexandrium_andersonii.AAC.1
MQTKGIWIVTGGCKASPPCGCQLVLCNLLTTRKTHARSICQLSLTTSMDGAATAAAAAAASW